MLDEPIANSSMFALPRNTAPSRSRLAVTVLSYGGTNGLEDVAARRRAHALGAEQVLDRERNAGERRRVALRASAASAASACRSAASCVTVI